MYKNTIEVVLIEGCFYLVLTFFKTKLEEFNEIPLNDSKVTLQLYVIAVSNLYFTICLMHSLKFPSQLS